MTHVKEMDNKKVMIVFGALFAVFIALMIVVLSMKGANHDNSHTIVQKPGDPDATRATLVENHYVDDRNMNGEKKSSAHGDPTYEPEWQVDDKKDLTVKNHTNQNHK